MKLPPEKINPALRDCISFQLSNKGLPELDLKESNSSALSRAFESIPQIRFIEQAQYLREHMLPKIAANRGTDSSDYKFYYAVFESLMTAIKMADRDQSIRMMISNEKLLNEFLQKRLLFLESELQKYTTLEELTMKELATELSNRQTTAK
jgi:hypothetical protein